MGILQKFVTLLAFEPDKQSVAAADKVIGGIRNKLLALAAVGTPAAIAAGFVKTLQDSANAADAVAKGARAIGITTAAYQELGYAAGLSGLSQQELNTALVKNAAKVAEAKKGNKELAGLYRSLGLNVSSLSKLKPDEQFAKIGDALGKVEDAGKRTGIALKLFEEAGPKFASLFAGGAAGIEAMRAEARDLGLIIPEDLTLRAEVFNDSLSRIKQIASGVATLFVLRLLPAIQPVLDELTTWSKQEAKGNGTSGALSEISISLVQMFRAMRDGVVSAREFSAAFGGASNVLKMLAAVVLSFVAANYLLKLGGAVQLLTVANLKWAASTLAAALPLLVLGAAIAAVVFGLQDFVTYLEGGDSELEQWIGPNSPELLADLQRGMLGVLGVLGLVAVLIGSIPIAILVVIGLVALLALYWEEVSATLVEFWDTLLAELGNFAQEMKIAIVDTWDEIISAIGAAWDELIDYLAERLRPIAEMALSIAERVGGAVGATQLASRFASGGASSVAADLTAGAVQQYLSAQPAQTNNISVQVDARGMDEGAAARAVSSGVQDAQLREARRAFAPRATGT